MLTGRTECQECNGSLLLEGDEWRCLQCGGYYVPDSISRDSDISERDISLSSQPFFMGNQSWRNYGRLDHGDSARQLLVVFSLLGKN